MKIILLGYMGSGKTTVGKALASELKLPFLDLDAFIEEKEKLSIGAIFKEKGEVYFRKKESNYLKDLISNEDFFVLALGGGTPCYANNMGVINNSNAKSFYLKGSIQTLVDRALLGKDRRPLIAEIDNEKLPEFIAKHLFERKNEYEKADVIISINHKTTEEVVKEISSNLS